MLVYRVGKAKYALDLSGEGARLYGGRWNHKLIPCVYTSGSRALAVLEYTVNANIDEIPRAMSLVTLEIPDSHILELRIADLPGNWQASPAPAETRDYGTALLKAAEWPVIRIPSAVIPAEFNYLLNPLHPERKSFRVVEVADFVYDVRIKG